MAATAKTVRIGSPDESLCTADATKEVKEVPGVANTPPSVPRA